MEFYERSINNAGTAKPGMKHIQFHTNLIAFYITRLMFSCGFGKPTAHTTLVLMVVN